MLFIILLQLHYALTNRHLKKGSDHISRSCLYLQPDL